MDNWFTSIPLAEELLGLGLTCVGTVKKNKPDIPPQLQPSAAREVMSSIFAFDGFKTLVSFVPKKKKAVMVLSTMHHDSVVDQQTSKPEIILYYNATKGGVDTCDQMVKSMSVKRKTNRWPMAVFYRMLDFAALNACIIWGSLREEEAGMRRSKFVKRLGMELAKPYILNRSATPQLQKSIRHSMQLCGISFLVQLQDDDDAPAHPKKKRRCHICPSSLDRKVQQTCDLCHRAACKRHCTKTVKLVCTECNGETE